MNWLTELADIQRPQNVFPRQPETLVNFVCPNPDCETETLVEAHVSAGEWEVLTADQCACCLRVITAADRHALIQTAQANVLDRLRSARDAHENSQYDRVVGR